MESRFAGQSFRPDRMPVLVDLTANFVLHVKWCTPHMLHVAPCELHCKCWEFCVACHMVHADVRSMLQHQKNNIKKSLLPGKSWILDDLAQVKVECVLEVDQECPEHGRNSCNLMQLHAVSCRMRARSRFRMP